MEPPAPAPIGRGGWLAFVLLLVAAIEALDVAVGHTLSFTPLYMVPVGLTAWNVGRRAGLAVAVLVSITWIAADLALVPLDGWVLGMVGNAATHLIVSVATVLALTTIRAAQRERERLVSELEEALANVKTLSGLLPVCAWCKRIRDEQGEWKPLEPYVAQRTDADFTHGICPTCVPHAT